MTDHPSQPPHQPPPSGPVAPNGDADEAAVAAEWQRLEAERIALEREEAREDAEDDLPNPAPRWPWQAFAAALIAGLVLAVALNWASLVPRPDAAPPATGQPQP